MCIRDSDGIITLVDAKHIEQHLDEEKPEGAENEAVEQVAFADRLILNKTDLVPDLVELGKVERRLRAINKFAAPTNRCYASVSRCVASARTRAAAPQPAPTLVLCTLTVAVWLLAGRAISIRHKAPAAALRVPATPRACSKRSAACNTLAKGKPAEKHQPDGAVPASTRAQVSGSPRH